MKCKRCTPEAKCNSHAWLSKPRSAQHKANVAAAVARAHAKGSYDYSKPKGAAVKGRPKSASQRAGAKAGVTKAWDEGRFRFRKRFSDTSLELAVEEQLRLLDYEYTKQVRVGRYVVDFMLADGTVIEANGCYWHRCKLCGFKDDIRARFRDARRIRSLQSRGHDVIVIWEHDAKNGVYEWTPLRASTSKRSSQKKLGRS